jgi:hypothetical protein
MSRAKISLDSQISAVNLAVQNVHTLHKSRSQSDLLKRQLEEAEATLRFVRRHQDIIRAAIQKHKEGRS